MRKSIDSAILLASFTAILYSWSTAHYHGFLTTINLDSDVMERNFHQVIYNGFVLSFSHLSVMLIMLTFALFFWSHGVLPLYIDYVRGSTKAKRRSIRVRRYWIGKRITPTIEKKEKRRFNQIALYTFFAIFFILSLAYFERKGQRHAENVIEHFLAGENAPQDIISVTINGSVRSLRYLGCGAQNCAGIEKDSHKIYYFPHSSGFSFTYDKKK